MKFNNWQYIKSLIIRLPKNEDKDPQLSNLPIIAKLNNSQENHPFKIIDIREKGFIVKIYGLFGFISFNHMPWKYIDNESWRIVFPYLKGKVLFGRIFKFEKETLSIIIDGKIPQFKKPELYEDEKYSGVIINKTNYGVFVDIGNEFEWKFGSIVGLIHKLCFEDEEVFKHKICGEIIELTYWGYNENKQLVFGNKPELKDWFTGEINNLLEKTLSVYITRTDKGKLSFLAENKYKAIIPANKLLYPGNKAKIKKSIIRLKKGDIIHCRVIELDKIKKVVKLKWELADEIKAIGSRIRTVEFPVDKSGNHKELRNRLKTEVVKKLESLK